MRLSQLYGNDRYHLLFNNCESFVTWCLEGLNESQQVRNLLRQVPYLKVALMGDRLVREVSAVNAGNKSISRAIVDTISSPEINLGSWALDIANDQLNVPYADELNRGAARLKEDVTRALESGERDFKNKVKDLSGCLNDNFEFLKKEVRSRVEKVRRDCISADECTSQGGKQTVNESIDEIGKRVQTLLNDLSQRFR